jgi:tetratricopeptide (TPR) repeat protein
MTLASLPATLLLAALAVTPLAARAAPDEQEPPASGPRPMTLAEVSRAFTVVDDAERQGTLAEQRTRWLAATAANRLDPGPRLLAAYALPHGDDTWAELKYLSGQFKTSAIPWVAMWRLYLEWGVLDQIDRSLPQVREVEKGNWLIGLIEALVAERRGQAGPATDGFKAVLALDPDNVDAHVGLARLALAAGEEASARLEAEAALKALPAHSPALLVLAGLAESRSDLASAATIYRKVVAANARDRGSRVKLARMLRKNGDAAGARDQWKAALALKEDAETLVALAEAARLCGDSATEHQSLERLSALDPGGVEWRRIAEIRVQAGDTAGAERALRQAVSRDAKEPQNHLALGRLLAGSGRTGEGLEHLRAAGEVAAADREAVEKRINVQKQVIPDVAVLQRSVGRLIDMTYRQRLKELPRLSGKLTIRVTTDASGRAALVEVLDDTLHDDDVRACAYWNLKDAAYPAQKPGRSSFSFTLRPGR